MNASQLIGSMMFCGVFVGMIVGLARSFGWRDALLMLGGALLLAGTVVVSVLLIFGKIAL